MFAKDLISEYVPVLKTSDTGLKALNLMDEFKISHLPIVNREDFLGLISDTDIAVLNTYNEAIGNHKLSLIRPFVKGDQHIYQVIKLIAAEGLSIVPVLDENGKYMGVITMQDLISEFAQMTSVVDHLGILILEINAKDYSLAEISQIVEGSNAKILSFYISSHTDSELLELTLNINKNDLTSVIKSFERYGYQILSSYHEPEYIDDVKRKYDEFMKYLNI